MYDGPYYSWLKQINYYGFSVVVGVDTHTVLQKVRTVFPPQWHWINIILLQFIRSKFSHLQPTIYGEVIHTYVHTCSHTSTIISLQVFDVKSMKDPAVVDLGYSSEELLFHQDLLFYESPPGIELFHCIKSVQLFISYESSSYCLCVCVCNQVHNIMLAPAHWHKRWVTLE